MLRRLSFIFQVRKSIPFIFAYFRSPQVASLKKAGILALFFGYFLFPFDLLPDVIPGFGYLDELTLLGFLLNFIVKEAPQELKSKYDLG